MKRICFFSGGMNRGGGTEHMTQLLANELANKEFDVYVLSKSDKNEPLFYLLDEKIHYSALDNKKYRGKLSLVKDILLLCCYIRKNKIDVLVNVDVSLGAFSLPLKILCPSLKQVFWEHFHVGYDVDNKRMEMLRKKALLYGDCYVTLTKQDAVDVKNKYMSNCKITTIPNICEFSYEDSRYDDQSRMIISVGNMLPVKGFDMALDVAKIVLAEHPDWKWEFCGDGIELPSLMEKVQNFGMQDKVMFSGRVNDIGEHYKKSAIFVMTSRSEGFGLVIAEAQSYRLPVVAFDVPYGPRNLITQNKNGFLVEAFDIDKMAEKVNMLISDVGTRCAFSNSATKDLQLYTRDNVAKQWMEVLGDL